MALTIEEVRTEVERAIRPVREVQRRQEEREERSRWLGAILLPFVIWRWWR
jgi:hypothetical protein